MKVLIIALDGLEYDLVVKERMRFLLQKTYGKIDISPEYCTLVEGELTPYTPIIWASFITGLPPHKHKIRDLWTYGKVFDSIKRFPPLRAIKGKRKFVWRLGLKPRTPNKKDLRATTIFDVIEPSTAIDVIGYNPWGYMEKLSSSKTIDEYIHGAKKLFELKKKVVFEEIKKNWNLFMAYIHFTDAAGHCYGFGRLKTVYRAMDYFVSEVKEIVGADTLCLIVSDHGMEEERTKDGRGTKLHIHSNHAFFSLNIETDWRPENMTDFFPKILEWAELN